MNLQFIITLRPYLFSRTMVSGQLCLPSLKIPCGIFNIDCWFSLLSVFILTSLPSFWYLLYERKKTGPFVADRVYLEIVIAGCKENLELRDLSSRVCDGVPDCADLSDELSCRYCRSGYIHCPNSPVCIPPYKRCNGDFDCPDRSDEKACCKLLSAV